MVERSRGALANVKVIDLTQMLAGPYCRMMLADQGADVIRSSRSKAIPPATGRFARTMTATFRRVFPEHEPQSKSIALDLKSEDGKALFRTLVRGADVVVENFRAGVMDRLGIGYEDLAKDHPKLVYAAIRGFGDPRTGSSPYADRPAFDVVAQAMGGAMSVTGPMPPTPDEDRPRDRGYFSGVLGRLRHLAGSTMRLERGRANSSMSRCMMACSQCANASSTSIPIPVGRLYQRATSIRSSVHLAHFPPATVRSRSAVLVNSFWQELVGIMGRPDLSSDPRFATNNDRLAHAQETVDLVEAWTSIRTKAEIADALDGRVPFGPVNTAADIFADPHVAAREMLVEVEHPGSARPVTIAGSPIHMTATPGGVMRRAPITGEDTDAVLGTLGLSNVEIAALRSRGVVA